MKTLWVPPYLIHIEQRPHLENTVMLKFYSLFINNYCNGKNVYWSDFALNQQK